MTSSTGAGRARWAVAVVVAVVAVGILLTWLLTRPGGGSSAATGGPTSPGLPTSSGHHKHVPSPSLGTSLTPGSGGTEPAHAVRTLKPVPLNTGTADFRTGLTVRVTDITPVMGKATQPGEVGGPALRFRLKVHNASRRPVSLDGAVVFVSYGRTRTPAVELSRDEQRFQGSVPAGASRRGTYIFTVPRSERSDVRVEISYTGRAPTVVLEGAA
jgi:hypothetical protein